MTNKAFSKRMTDSKKRTASSQSYKWRARKTPWKIFIDAVTKPRDSALGLFGNKRFVLAIVMIIIILGGIVLSQGPLFHSVQPKAVGTVNSDPYTMIWQTTAPNGNLGEYNTFNGTNGGLARYQTNCIGTLPCIDLGSDTTVTSIALAKTSVGDLSVVSGKQLASGLKFRTTSTTLTANIVWGFYLTSENSTAPHHDIGSNAAYEPRNDQSVAMVVTFACIAACGPGVKSIEQNTYFLRSLGVSDTINKEDAGCGAGSVYMCGSATVDPNDSHGSWASFMLNYTGSAPGGGGPNTCSNFTGTACSFQALSVGNGAAVADASSQTIPWFNFQSQQYYMGFFVKPGLGSEVYFTFNTAAAGTNSGVDGVNQLAYFVPSPTAAAVPPNIDTGGFFGPIIRALITIGVFIAQNIINFLAFLAGVLFPVLSTVFGVLIQALVGVLNVIGNFFGLGNIGSNILTFFNNLGNLLVSGIGAILGQISNAWNFFVNGVTAFVNLATTYFGYVTSFLSAVQGFLGILGTVITALLTLSAFSGNLALFMDWTWGMYKVYDEGTEGFHRWLDFNEKVFLRAGTITYGIVDYLFEFVLQVKQLIVQWI